MKGESAGLLSGERERKSVLKSIQNHIYLEARWKTHTSICCVIETTLQMYIYIYIFFKMTFLRLKPADWSEICRFAWLTLEEGVSRASLFYPVVKLKWISSGISQLTIYCGLIRLRLVERPWRQKGATLPCCMPLLVESDCWEWWSPNIISKIFFLKELLPVSCMSAKTNKQTKKN